VFPCVPLWLMSLLPTLPIHHPLDTVPQMSDIEIDQQSDLFTAQPKVRKQLSLMDRVNRFDAIQFNHDKILNHQINAIAKLNLLPFIDNRQTNLGHDLQSSHSQFVRQTSLIRTLQQSGAEYRGTFIAAFTTAPVTWLM